MIYLFFKKTVERILRFLARMTLVRYRPIVVGITGSVGKSSTKEATALILEKNYSVRKSRGNYNNEFGVPLTILGIESAGRSVLRWSLGFARILFQLLIRRTYPEVLVLEMGVDRPGDMTYLLECVKPNISVFTGVSSSHLAHFGTLNNILKEKGQIITTLSAEGTAVLNADDERVMKIADRTRARVITYGFSESAQVRAEHVKLIQEGNRIDGLSFKLTYEGKSIPVRLPATIGKHHIGPILAAAAVGIALKMNLVDIADALISFRSLPGRLMLLPGKAGMRIIDDSYNASPLSTRAALMVVRDIIAPRKVVILGDMLEIGSMALEEHRALAEGVLKSGTTVFVGVGRYMQALADVLRQTKFPEKQIYTFPDPVVAKQAIPEILRPQDLVLIKGSQGLRMEIILEELIADTLKKSDVLCRQSRTWRNRPFSPPDEWFT